MTDIIVFGAGKNGKECLKKYGDRIVYFADNDITKAANRFEGHRVLTINEYIEKCKDYHTIIAITRFAEVVKEIDEMCDGDYSFFIPEYEEQIINIAKLIKERKGRIVFLGVSDATFVILKNLEYEGIEVKNIVIADKPDSSYIGKQYYGHTIKNIKESVKNDDIIVISSPERTFPLMVYAKRELSEYEVVNYFIRTSYYNTEQIVINRYEGVRDKNENEYIESGKTSGIQKSVREYSEELYKKLPLFEFIEIETVNWCNGMCEFCPVSVPNNRREKVIMDESVFYSIIDQLADLNYSGRLALFSNGEPFLDHRIIDFHRYAREKCKKARIHLFTNGTLLTMDKFLSIIDYLDEMIIDNYNQDLKLIKNSEQIYEYCLAHKELKPKVSIVLRKPTEILTSRGGDAPNRTKQVYYPDESCVLPFKQMTIRAEGKVSLCCNDVFGKITLGDLRTDKLIDIWYGERFEAVRKALLVGRKECAGCMYCDAFSLF